MMTSYHQHPVKPHKCLLVRDVSNVSDQGYTGQVSVCGIVVDIVKPNPDIHSNRPLAISIDDGTGEVRCVMFGFQNYPHLLVNLSIGNCCVVRGVVTKYNNQIQIKSESIKLVTDPNFETLWINKILYEKQNGL